MVVKNGGCNALALRGGSVNSAPAMPVLSPIDTTGADDSLQRHPISQRVLPATSLSKLLDAPIVLLRRRFRYAVRWRHSKCCLRHSLTGPLVNDHLKTA